jgi:hypothetical protein
VIVAKLRKNSVGTVKIILSAAERAGQMVDRERTQCPRNQNL